MNASEYQAVSQAKLIHTYTESIKSMCERQLCLHSIESSNLIQPCQFISNFSNSIVVSGYFDFSNDKCECISTDLSECMYIDEKKKVQRSFVTSGEVKQPVLEEICDNSHWVQLAGHAGCLISDGKGRVLKQYDPCEAQCLLLLQSDVLERFVPNYYGECQCNGLRYIQMQDLVFGLRNPSVMDCKIGQRSYLESEVVTGVRATHLRPDMYQKMIEVDRQAPTATEHAQRAVTKLRYMQWRDSLSTTASFGFRIEALKIPGEPTNRDFKCINSWAAVQTQFAKFIQSNSFTAEQYLSRLRELKSTLLMSKFFAERECIGSSLLFAHDDLGLVNVWMIDFGKTVPLPDCVKISHQDPYIPGNHEDGYLIGLDNLIKLFEQLSFRSEES